MNILQAVIEILGFYHPAVWWVSRRIRIERENCCDDVAVRIVGDKVHYARTLTLLEEARGAQSRLAVAAGGGSLFERVSRLVSGDCGDVRRPGRAPAVIAIVVLAGMIVPATVALSSKAGASPDAGVEGADDSKYVGTLANGVTVELVGICEYPSEGKQWWRPDGAVLHEAPVPVPEGPLRMPLKNPLEFAFKVTSPNMGSLSITGGVEIPGKRAAMLMPIRSRSIKQDEGIRFLAGGVKESADAVDLRVGIAVGDFDRTLVCDVNEVTNGKGRLGDILFSVQKERGGRVNITLSGGLGINDFMFVPVDSRGQVHLSDRGTLSYAGSEIDQIVFSFTGFDVGDIRE